MLLWFFMTQTQALQLAWQPSTCAQTHDRTRLLHCMQLAKQMMGQAEGQQLQQLKGVHKSLLGQLSAVITSPATSSREVATAVAGIGELAAPTQRFFGQQVDTAIRFLVHALLLQPMIGLFSMELVKWVCGFVFCNTNRTILGLLA